MYLNQVIEIGLIISTFERSIGNGKILIYYLIIWETSPRYVNTATHQAMQNQNKLAVDCTGTSYKLSSGNTSFACVPVYSRSALPSTS